MTLDELIAQFRSDTDDLTPDYLSSDLQVTGWLDEAQEEAAIRKSLLHESTDPAICQIAILPGVRSYRLHKMVTLITYAQFVATGATQACVLTATDRMTLDAARPGWRSLAGEPRAYIQNDTTIDLDYLPTEAGILTIEAYRVPVMSIADSDEPEIASTHHRHLIQWALHRCYSRPDAEVHDPKRADRALSEFTRYFGIRPDADLLRTHQANRPSHNTAIW